MPWERHTESRLILNAELTLPSASEPAGRQPHGRHVTEPGTGAEAAGAGARGAARGVRRCLARQSRQSHLSPRSRGRQHARSSGGSRPHVTPPDFPRHCDPRHTCSAQIGERLCCTRAWFPPIPRRPRTCWRS